MAILSAGNKSKLKSKKWLGRSGPDLLDNIADQVEQAEHVGEGQLKWVKLEDIRPDPLQPRTTLQTLGITPDSVKEHVAGRVNLADPANPDRAEAFDKLVALASTIREHSLIQPITVYRADDGLQFEIEAGERRFLSHILNGATEIRAIVRDHIERDMKTRRQLIENLAREGLTLKEIVEGVLAVHQDQQRKTGQGIEANELASMIGVTSRHARRYLAIAFGPQDVLDAIRSGELTSVKLAAQVVTIDSPQLRQEYIANKGVPQSQEKATTAPAKPEQKQKAQRGRPLEMINLGSTRSISAIRALIKGYLPDEVYQARYSDVDWSDYKAVNKVWQTFWQSIEKADTVSARNKRK